MNPVRASLRFPQVTLVLTAMMFIVGITEFLTMPRREDPKITIRTGLVIAEYPGATAEEVESQVTHKIEERLFRFEEVRREKTYSTSRNGLVIINVELNKSVKNSDQFWSKLRLDLAQLKQTDLPSGVRGPIVDSDFGDTVAGLIAVKGGHYGYRELKDYAQRVESAVRTIPAASKIKRIGDQKESIEVTSSWERISQYGVDPQKVEKALQGRNTIMYGGRVPSGDSKPLIDPNGQFQTEDQIRQIMVDVSPTGQPIYLGDLANVKRVYKDPTEYARIGGEPTILLSVEMHEGNNIVEFGKTIARNPGACANHSTARCTVGFRRRPAPCRPRARAGLHARIRNCDHLRHSRDHGVAAHASRAGLRGRYPGYGFHYFCDAQCRGN